jgi:hypothetical protein
MAEPDKLPEPSPEQKPTPTQQAVEDISWDIPFARTILNTFVKEGKAVKSGWLAFAVIAGITFWITHSWTESGVDAKISTATNYLSGELSKMGTEISNLKGQLTDAKQDRDKYQMMLAPFEAMAIAKYTNAPLDERLDLLANGMMVITNAMRGFAKQAVLELCVNDRTNLISKEWEDKLIEVNNFLIVTNRQIRINLLNLSKFTATHAFVDFVAPIDPTNVIVDGWHQGEAISTGWNHWRYDVDHSIPSKNGWRISTILILTNFTTDSFFARFDAGADNAETKSYFIMLQIQDQQK